MTDLPSSLLEPLVRAALNEDLAQGGDLSSLSTIDRAAEGSAALRLRTGGVVAGTALARIAFALVDPRIELSLLIEDGEHGEHGETIMRAEGPVVSLLTAERTALNFLTHLSGIATLTAAYVAETQGTAARIAATRKTLPGLRLVQKHAVRMGGGMTHRMSLSDAVMIKDNHVAASASIADAVAKARAYAGHTVKIELEVDTLAQLEEALPAKPDIILLDNMSTDELRKAVELNSGQAILEASGGVNLDTVRAIAQTGVDVISVGALTHSAPALDIGMDLAG
ncbi:carboxylating nicotinate-nucleotide diphosphorylase [Parvularcula maris]|uniref:Probable nicotinate-nucleotide pyrophosphorylase [carboxylating] n=1 Tax=Parvularcula maris TaxID=2965077 RepID=A0A9X2RK64_9PROT|nr:carboxylating nicotinate-nucleotide diphosphorylase [Parvularcula maris]MCQ8185297.1 carboxylating nicotinate-nucleotide diphosphorylase [Parvularcula maris]